MPGQDDQNRPDQRPEDYPSMEDCAAKFTQRINELDELARASKSKTPPDLAITVTPGDASIVARFAGGGGCVTVEVYRDPILAPVVSQLGMALAMTAAALAKGSEPWG